MNLGPAGYRPGPDRGHHLAGHGPIYNTDSFKRRYSSTYCILTRDWPIGNRVTEVSPSVYLCLSKISRLDLIHVLRWKAKTCDEYLCTCVANTQPGRQTFKLLWLAVGRTSVQLLLCEERTQVWTHVSFAKHHKGQETVVSQVLRIVFWGVIHQG
jgi:hypothetical protein